MDKKLYALIRYDQYPYWVGREVEDIDEKGRVKCQGYLYTPGVILPYEQGKAIMEKLNELEGEYRTRVAQLSGEYVRRMKEIVTFPDDRKFLMEMVERAKKTEELPPPPRPSNVLIP